MRKVLFHIVLVSNMEKKIIVLIADDDRSTRKVYADILRLAHFEVDEAENGKDALELFQLRRHDVVLVGIDMPGMNGFELIRNIRNLPGKRPFVFVNSHTDREEDRAMASELKVDGYFVKNFHAPMNVVNQIKGFFGDSIIRKDIEIHLEKANNFNTIVIFSVVVSSMILVFLGFLVYRALPKASFLQKQTSSISQPVSKKADNEVKQDQKTPPAVSMPITPVKIRSLFARIVENKEDMVTLQTVGISGGETKTITADFSRLQSSAQSGMVVEIVLPDFVDAQSIDAHLLSDAESVRVVSEKEYTGQ